ncbi:hypothetical protein Efla_007220 [Eimeria flavescens]
MYSCSHLRWACELAVKLAVQSTIPVEIGVLCGETFEKVHDFFDKKPNFSQYLQSHRMSLSTCEGDSAPDDLRPTTGGCCEALSVMNVALYLGGLSLAPVAASDSVSVSGESIAERRPEVETSIINSRAWTGQEDFPDATDGQSCSQQESRYQTMTCLCEQNGLSKTASVPADGNVSTKRDARKEKATSVYADELTILVRLLLCLLILTI